MKRIQNKSFALLCAFLILFSMASPVYAASETFPQVISSEQASMEMQQEDQTSNQSQTDTKDEEPDGAVAQLQLTVQDGWEILNNGQKVYYLDGQRVTGTQTIEGKCYYFSSDGIMQTGWQSLYGGTGWGYYDPSTGALKLNEKFTVDGKIYYSGGAGTTLHGVLEVDGKTYSFTGDKNAAQSGYLPLGNGKYGTFDDVTFELVKGKTGWEDVDGGRAYYLDGQRVTGTQTIEGKCYYFSSDGIMQTGWQSLYGGTGWGYYDPSTGALKLNEKFTVDGKIYYSGGAGTTLHGVLEVDGKTYSFTGDKNAAQSGYLPLGNGKYGTFDDVTFELVKGKTGWEDVDGGRAYYLDGQRVTGTQTIEGKCYYFSSDGIMQTGWQSLYGGTGWGYYDPSTGALKLNEKFTVDGKIYYSGGAGTTLHGVLEVDGKTYSFTGDKNAAQSGYLPLGNGKYGTFDDVTFELVKGKTGWEDVDGGRAYYLDGQRVTGTQTIEGKCYYFSSDGIMQTGWQSLYGGIGWGYYDPSTGALKLNEKFTVDGKIYYSGGAGTTLHGVLEVDGKTYSFTGDKNAAQSGYLPLGNGKYGTFDDVTFELVKGKTGWEDVDGGRAYYLDGQRVTGTQTIEGKCYYFSSDGIMQTGWQSLYGGIGWGYYDPSTGALKLNEKFTVDGKIYYSGGAGTTLHGVLEVDGKTYSFTGDKNAAQSGYLPLGNGKYGTFDDVTFELVKGKTGWEDVDGGRAYYLDGQRVTGTQTIEGKCYYFSSDGIMQTGWQSLYGGTGWGYYDPSTGALKLNEKFTVDGKIYYSGGAGTTLHGVLEVDGKTYSFTGDKNAAQSGYLPLGNGKYGTFDDVTFELVKGKTGWEDVDGGRAYYLDGQRVTGTQTIEGKCYYFSSDGIMQTGWQSLYGGTGWGYYDPSTGALKLNEKFTVDGKIYYSGGAGTTLHGVLEVDGKTYSFTGDKNAAQSGYLPLGNGKYGTFDDVTFELVKGKTGWEDVDGGRAYYLDGQRVTGTQTIEGKCYYFSSDGIMQTGWQSLYGGTGWGYYDPSTGALKLNEKFTVDGKIYYSGGAGTTLHGVLEVDGKTYSFTGDRNAAQSGGNFS